MDIDPAFEEVVNRLQRSGPSSMTAHATAADAMTWLWAGWHPLIPDRIARLGVWMYANSDWTRFIAFEDTDTSRAWATLAAEERYWSCFAPLINLTSDNLAKYVAYGDTLVDLIENMSTRRHPDRLAWVAAAQQALTGGSESAQMAAFLVGLGGGGDMGALALRQRFMIGPAQS